MSIAAPGAPKRFFQFGIPELDVLIGSSVIPGSVVEIYGGPGSGKTSILLLTAQKEAAKIMPAYFFDCDHSVYKIMYGVPYFRPKSLIEATDMLEGVRKERGIYLIDSVNSLPETKDEYHHAALSGFMNKIVTAVSESESYAVVTSQVRLGNVSASGKAVSRHAAVRIMMERLSTIKRKEKAGCLVKATLLPSRSGLKGSTELEILYDRRK